MAAAVPMSTTSLRVTEIDFEREWAAVRTHCEAILQDPFFPSRDAAVSRRTLAMKLHNKVYKLSSGNARNVPTMKRGSDLLTGPNPQATQCLVLYFSLREMLRTHVEKNVRSRVSGHDGDLIRSYIAQWDRYTVGLRQISSIFIYLHAQWNHPSLTALGTTLDTWQQGMRIWLELLLAPLRDTITNSLLTMITTDRAGISIDEHNLKRVLVSFCSMTLDPRRINFYTDTFETPFITMTQSHYENVSALLIRQIPANEYVAKADELLRHERHRVDRYLEKITRNSLSRVVAEKLVLDHKKTLLAEVRGWIKTNQRETLCKLYKLMSEAQNDALLEELRKTVEDIVAEEGAEELEKIPATEWQRDTTKLVNGLFDVYARFRDLLVEIFDNNQFMMHALSAGAKTFTNRTTSVLTPAKTAEYLAKYCHALLRPGASHGSIDDYVKNVMTIFGLLEERDVFQHVYASLFSNRLIYGHHREEDELTVIDEFQRVYGHEFTFRWQRMFADIIQHSKRFTQRFREKRNPQLESMGISFSAQVLTCGSWPSVSLPSKGEHAPPIPRPLQSHYVAFSEFYKSECQMRSLTWLPMMSYGTVKSTCLGKPYEFSVSQWQFVLLNMFNVAVPNAEGDLGVSLQSFLTEAEMKESAVLQKAVTPLLKNKLIVQKDINGDTWYALNTGFNVQIRKVNLLPMPGISAGVANTEEAATTKSAVEGERKFAIQAAIVRIMKSRRTAKYSDIVHDVLHQMHKFRPSQNDIKLNLEALIEKEYIERGEQQDSFRYLA